MESPTLSLRSFWDWLVQHPNCIVRAGTPEAVLYDDEHLHWFLGAEDEATLLLQLIRGKRLMGEVFIQTENISYVEIVPSERDDEHVFQLIAESAEDRAATFYVVMTHGLDDGATEDHGPVH